MTTNLKLFLSHDWAYQARNHEKVTTIHTYLAPKIQKAWIDDQRMIPGDNLEREISNAILDCDVLVVFVTDHYQMKYNSGSQSDYCYFELCTALLQQKPILPILLEKPILSPPFQTRISSLLCFDMSDPSLFSDPFRLNEFCDQIVRAAESLKNSDRPEPRSVYSDHLLSELRKHLEDPVDIGWKFRKEREKFVEGTREWLMKEVLDWIPLRTSKVCWIRGEAGTGKTVFTTRLAERLGRQLVGIFFFTFNDARCSDPCEMVRSLIYQIGRENRSLRDGILRKLNEVGKLSSLGPKDMMEVLLGVLSILHDQEDQDPAIPQDTYVIILDALDELGNAADNKRQKFLRFLSDQLIQKLPSCFRVIVTGRPEDDVMAALREWDPLIIDETDVKHQEDMRLYIEQCLREYTEDRRELEELAGLLMKKSEGKFVYLHAMTEKLTNLRGSSREARLQTISEFPQGLNDYYDKYFSQLRDRLGGDRMKILMKVASIILVVRESVSIDDLEWLFEEEGLSLKELEYYASEMKSIFPLDESSRCFRVYHKSIVDYLVDRKNSGEFLISLSVGHQFLSKRLLKFEEIEAKPNGDQFHVVTVQYLHRYLFDHLDEGPSSDQQKTFQKLTSLTWLQQTVQSKGIAAVIHDCYKRLSNSSWRKPYPRDRQEVGVIYRFLKLIAVTELPRGSEQWATVLCTQITGRLEDKEEYGYSREMKQLIVDAREWLGRVDGYGFLRPCALKRAHESYELLRINNCLNDRAHLLSKDQLLVAFDNPARIECINVQTNEQEWNIPLTASWYSSFAVLSPARIVIRDKKVVSMWDTMRKRKLSDLNLLEYYRSDIIDVELCPIPGEERVLISFRNCGPLLLWDGIFVEVKVISFKPWYVRCYKAEGRLKVLCADRSETGIYSYDVGRNEMILITNSQKTRITEDYKLTNMIVSEAIVMFTHNKLFVWKANSERFTWSLPVADIYSLCEIGPNIALMSTRSGWFDYSLITVDILTGVVLQRISMPTSFIPLECVDSTVVGVYMGSVTVFELSALHSSALHSSAENTQPVDLVSLILHKKCSFNLAARDLLYVLEDTSSLARIFSYRIDRARLMYAPIEKKEFPISSVGNHYEIDSKWESLLRIRNGNDVVLVLQDLRTRDSVSLAPNSGLKETVFLSRKRLVLIREVEILRYRFLYEFFEKSQLQYCIALGTDRYSCIKQISEDIVVLEVGMAVFLWHLDLKQMKRLNSRAFRRVYGAANFSPEGAIYPLEENDAYCVIDRVDWEENRVLLRSFSIGSLLKYTQEHHLPLHLKFTRGTPAEAICLDEQRRVFSYFQEGVMIIYEPWDTCQSFVLVRCGEEKSAVIPQVQTSLTCWEGTAAKNRGTAADPPSDLSSSEEVRIVEELKPIECAQLRSRRFPDRKKLEKYLLSKVDEIEGKKMFLICDFVKEEFDGEEEWS